jgi:hypothetical protein
MQLLQISRVDSRTFIIPEDGCSIFLRNVDVGLQVYRTLQRRRSTRAFWNCRTFLVWSTTSLFLIFYWKQLHLYWSQCPWVHCLRRVRAVCPSACLHVRENNGTPTARSGLSVASSKTTENLCSASFTLTVTWSCMSEWHTRYLGET